jgi:hypothetical protein
MITFVLLEKYNNIPTDSPSAEWLDQAFIGGDKNFIMRNNPSENITEGVLNLSSFSQIFKKRLELSKILLKSSTIWFRLPSPKVFLILVLNIRKLKGKKVYIHMCANRLTFSFLKQNFNFKNSIIFLYGKVVQFYLRRITNVNYFHTGTQVAKNFNITLNSQFIIDQCLEKMPKIPGSGWCYFGRQFKLLDDDLLKFLKINKIHLDSYGGGQELEDNHIESKGLVDSNKVPLLMNNYKTVILPGFEYFEGFPRILFTAITLNKHILIHSKSNFINDIKFYEKLSFYDKPNESIDQSEFNNDFLKYNETFF